MNNIYDISFDQYAMMMTIKNIKFSSISHCREQSVLSTHLNMIFFFFSWHVDVLITRCLYPIEYIFVYKKKISVYVKEMF